MGKINSPYFGTLAYRREEVLDFPGGLPGFEDEKHFVSVEQPASRPLIFLQSISSGLCLITAPVQMLAPEYVAELSADDQAVLGLRESRVRPGAELLMLAVLSVDDKTAAANLLAPIVINLRRRVGVQAIVLNEGYSHRHPVVERGGIVC